MEAGKLDENPVAEKLQRELAMRGNYYFKDLGMVMGAGLLANIEVFATAQVTEERATCIRNCLNLLVGCYDSIPFDEITDHPDFDIFLAVKTAIPQLESEVDQILAGKKDIEEAHQLIVFILDKGNEYRARLKSILEDIRKQPGLEDYGFQTTSILDGKVWTSGI